ncbi:MAG: hypothetical protein BWX70_03457 [Verrucomicrobia bacterium ADurb.Bin070]|nr:MAG: hypothetical protein BWX70_03457 [Verrucomicrobia bacterium ADurb.Bin070]
MLSVTVAVTVQGARAVWNGASGVNAICGGTGMLCGSLGSVLSRNSARLVQVSLSGSSETVWVLLVASPK